tara:strand:+ start:6652 stop:7152 length:501 start_codon:yes stop_codon:yes gene_type:complete
MATIFYNYDKSTTKLATVISDKTPAELIAMDVIPEGAAYLSVEDMTDDMTDEDERIKYNEVLYCSFDDYTNPTKIIVDYQAIMASLLEDIKPMRDTLVSTLDYLKVKAASNNKTSVVSEINDDIIALKACLTVDLSKYTKAADLKDYVPDIMSIDYDLKYEDRINA